MEQLDKNIKVSVLVPVFNVEKYISRCVASVFQQNFKEAFEVIFVNDCSTDDSLQALTSACLKYKRKGVDYKIIDHPQNLGLAGARESALCAAGGEYLFTVDSDDWLEEDALSILYDKAIQQQADIVVCDFYVNYLNRQMVRKQSVEMTPEDYFISILENRSHGGTCTQLIKRTLFIDNDIHYFQGLNMLEDISVDYRLYDKASSIAFVERPLYHYFQGNGGSYCTTLSTKSKANMLLLVDKMHQFYASKNISPRFQLAFYSFMMNVKAWIILDSGWNELDTHLGLYPKVKWQQCRLSKLYRIILFLSDKSKFLTFTFCRWVKFLKSLRN